MTGRAVRTDFQERKNEGTMFEMTDQATAYWMARMTSPRKDLFIMFIFDPADDLLADEPR